MMIDIPTLLPGISSIPPSLTLLIFLPIFPIIFLHISAGTKLPELPLPFSQSISNEDLLYTGGLIGIAAITALGIGLYPGALEGITVFIKEGSIDLSLGDDFNKVVGGVLGVKEERFGALGVKIPGLKRPSAFYVAANHVYALRYYYKSWYDPSKPRPAQALFIFVGVSIVLVIVIGKVLKEGYEYKAPEPVPEKKPGDLDPWVRGEIDKRKGEKPEETKERLKSDKMKQKEEDKRGLSKYGQGEYTKRKKRREENEKVLKSELEKRKMPYVSLDGSSSTGEASSAAGAGAGSESGPSSGSKKEEVKSEEKKEKKVGGSSIGDKFSRALFGKNIADAMKKESEENKKTASPTTTPSIPQKGPGWELADPRLAQQAMMSSAANAEALAQKMKAG